VVASKVKYLGGNSHDFKCRHVVELCRGREKRFIFPSKCFLMGFYIKGGKFYSQLFTEGMFCVGSKFVEEGKIPNSPFTIIRSACAYIRTGF